MRRQTGQGLHRGPQVEQTLSTPHPRLRWLFLHQITALLSSYKKRLWMLWNLGKFSLKPFPISSFHVVTLPGPSPVGCYPKSLATSCGRKASLCSRPQPRGNLHPHHPLIHTFAITPLTGAFLVHATTQIAFYGRRRLTTTSPKCSLHSGSASRQLLHFQDLLIHKICRFPKEKSAAIYKTTETQKEDLSKL